MIKFRKTTLSLAAQPMEFWWKCKQLQQTTKQTKTMSLHNVIFGYL